MSKFQEICAAFKDGRNNYIAYRDECMWAAGKLGVSLREFLEIPTAELRFFPLHEDPKPNTNYTQLGAMNLEKDGFWHFGISFRVYEAPNVFPQETIGIHFKLKKLSNKFRFEIDGIDQKFEVADLNDANEFNAICEFVHQRLVNNYRSNLRKFLEDTEERVPQRIIGFGQI